MSFTDPLSITISAATTPLPRVSVGENESEYLSGDGLLTVSASHKYGKRTRRSLRIDTKKMAPDPFDDNRNEEVSMSLNMVFDVPVEGYTASEAHAVYTGFIAMLSASSDQMITKLLGGES